MSGPEEEQIDFQHDTFEITREIEGFSYENGCSKETYENVIFHKHPLKASENSYDWLGHGIYFWEQNLKRAKEWATRKHGKSY